MSKSRLVILVLLALTVGCSASAKPKPDDVAAARACEAFSTFVAAAQASSTHKADGAPVVADAGKLLGGASTGQHPKYASLGSDMIEAAGDVNSGNLTALGPLGDRIGNTCKALPTAAKRAGGYVK